MLPSFRNSITTAKCLGMHDINLLSFLVWKWHGIPAFLPCNATLFPFSPVSTSDFDQAVFNVYMFTKEAFSDELQGNMHASEVFYK